MKISKKVAGVEYAIRDIVSAAREVEQQGKTVDYLNIGDPVQFGFQPPDNVKQAFEELGFFSKEVKILGFYPSSELRKG